MARKLVEKNRNGGTWSEAKYWGAVRSHLRRGFRYWKPVTDCKMDARRPNQSANKRLKWEFQCASCLNWFPDKEIQVDHIEAVGSLKCYGDLEGFLRRLTPEEGFQVMCKPCHQVKTNEERERMKDNDN